MKEDVAPLNDTPPPGNSAVEVAARRGFGPLSALASDAWHGDSRPCVSCGQLVRRKATTCDACGEDLSDEMIERMRSHAGPWYVLEHVRPFPGVTFERLLRQIRRGVLTRYTIVRGPTTDHQWRFAGETPGVSKHLGTCWNCQSDVRPDQTDCPACGRRLGEVNDGRTADFEARAEPSGYTESPELERLAALTRSAPRSHELEDTGLRIGSVRVVWIIATLLIVVMAVLFAVVKVRDSANHPPATRQTRLIQ